MTRLGTDLALHLPTELGTNLAGGGSAPAPEVPLTISGLKAWFDSRSTDYFALGAGGEVSAWMSRAGSLAGIAWLQGTASNQAKRVASVATFNGMPAVLFDGANDWLTTSDQSAWAFMHDGAGGSAFRLLRTDSTGGVVQNLFSNENASGNFGVTHAYSSATQAFLRYANGVTRENWIFSTVGHFERDVTRWQMFGLDTALYYSRVSGSSVTDANTAVPAAGAPSVAARLGASAVNSSPLKGWLAQDLYYDHVLTPAETTQLANYFAPMYAIAA